MSNPLRNICLTPGEIESAPELGALVALDAVLDIAVQILAVASHPELTDDERPYWLGERSASYAIAKNIVRLSGQMRNAILQYRVAVAQPCDTTDNSSSDDLDF